MIDRRLTSRPGIPLEKELSELAKALERGNINDVVQKGSLLGEAICNWFFGSNPNISVLTSGDRTPDFVDKLNTMKRYLRSSNPLLNLLSVFKMMWAAHGSRTSVTNNGDALVVIGATLSTGFYLLEFGLPKPDMTLDRKDAKEKERSANSNAERESRDKPRPSTKAVKDISKDTKDSARERDREVKSPKSPRTPTSNSTLRSPRGERERRADRDDRSERDTAGTRQPLSARRDNDVKKGALPPRIEAAQTSRA